MLNSFRSRLIILLLGLLALVQLITALAVLSSLKEDNYTQGVHAINVARNVFDLLLEERADQLTKGVEILSSDFGFKQAVATQEIATIQSVLKNHGARIGAAVSLLVSPDGDMIAATKTLPIRNTVSDLVFAARRSGGSSISATISLEGLAYQLVLVPVKAPNVIAWVGMAFLLDRTFAEQVKSVTGLEVSFVGEVDKGNRVTGISTLPYQEKEPLFSEISSVKEIVSSPKFTNAEKYLSLGINLDTKNQWGVLHLPYGPWLASYNRTRNQLLWIFAGTLALALIVGIALARNLTSPISHLVEYAKQIGLGGKRAKAPVFAGEFGLLSNTMMSMQDSITTREEELTYRASHDLLTGLYNRSAVEHYLSNTLPRTYGCLLLVNVRHLRNINNMLGFDTGDQLLVKTAQRLEHWAKGCQMMARVGGDEFLLVLEEEVSKETCLELRSSFDKEFELESGSVRLDISMAVLSFKNTPSSVNDMMRRLDITAGKAKDDVDACSFYQPGQDESHQRQLTIIRDLPQALASEQLFVVYQPKVGVEKRDCHEAEALIRWQHPSLGFVPPDEFITILEHAGSIQMLTQWVIRRVLSQLKEWWNAGHEIRVAINLSAHDLVDEQLPDIISKELSAYGLPTRAVAFEVTESAVMADRYKVVEVLKKLQQLGVHLAIDDFGTGQSSLAYLRELPVNEVKIDRAFIRYIDTNKGDEFIVRAAIELSHSLGFQVTAEGAENAEGVAILGAYQCDKIQGYFFSKPLIAEVFFQWRQDFNMAQDKK